MRALRRVEVFAACAVLAALASFAFDPSTAARFSAYGGGLPPITMLGLALIAGAPALWLLDRLGFFRPRRGPSLRNLRHAFHRAAFPRVVALTLGFAAVSVALDLLHPFPQGLNVRFPQSLLFYPAIAIFAETAFHLLPLALVLSLARRPGLAIAVAALCEPAFQVAAGLGQALHWSDILVGLNILGISLTQLIMFRRHGFLPMLAVRLSYYLWWHIIWGELRLTLLF